MRREFLPAMQRRHIQGLDGLRGIAVLGVIFYHLYPFTVKGGFLGVCLFFVISGYLIAAVSSADWREGKFDVLRFYLKRLKRIYPSLLIVVFATLGFFKILAPDVLNGIRPEVASIMGGYNNLWQISQNASYFTKISNASPFTHLWSLAIELQFYLIWPLIFLLYQYMRTTRVKMYSKYLFVALAAVSVLMLEFSFRPGQDVTNVYYGTSTRIFSLFLGAFMGVCRGNERKVKIPYARRRKQAFCFKALLLLTVLAYFLMDGQADFTYRGGLIISSFLFCILVKYAVNPSYPFGQWLDCMPLSWIGKHSFEIYLWQYPVIFIFQYKKWDRFLFSPVLILILIIVFSIWLHNILHTVSKKTHITGGREMKQIRKAAFRIATVFFAGSLMIGGCGMITAQNTKREEEKRLQEEMEKNSLKLQEQQIPADEERSLDSLTAIGDSVMLGAAPAIKEALPECVIDAQESRQVVQAVDVADTLESQGNLGDTVIVALGTNGTFDKSAGQALIDDLGKERNIYWITAYGEHLQWQDYSNETIYALARENENVNIIDWAETASGHSEWFYEDGIHLNADGQEAYAQLIKESII